MEKTVVSSPSPMNGTPLVWSHVTYSCGSKGSDVPWLLRVLGTLLVESMERSHGARTITLRFLDGALVEVVDDQGRPANVPRVPL